MKAKSFENLMTIEEQKNQGEKLIESEYVGAPSTHAITLDLHLKEEFKKIKCIVFANLRSKEKEKITCSTTTKKKTTKKQTHSESMNF